MFDVIKIAKEQSDKSWHVMFDELENECVKTIQNINNFFTEQYKNNKDKMTPLKKHIFRAFKLTSLDGMKVLVLGQDPYHNIDKDGKRQAVGLSFSIPKHMKIPSSLKNIYKNIESDLKLKMPDHGCLKSWSKQGVLLLNSSLTTQLHNPNKHQKIWSPFTDFIISWINKNKPDTIFMLWGAFALKKKSLMQNVPNENILISSHPSGFSCNKQLQNYSSFRYNQHFRICNILLKKKSNKEIQWSS